MKTQCWLKSVLRKSLEEFFCINETRKMLNVTLLLRLSLCPKTSDRNRHKLCGTYTGCPTWTQVKGCLISESSSSWSFLQANGPNHYPKQVVLFHEGWNFEDIVIWHNILQEPLRYYYYFATLCTAIIIIYNGYCTA